MEAVASYDYDAFESDQLSFKEGDVIKILKEVNSDWFDAELEGRFGVVPGNHISFEYPSWYEVVSKEMAVSKLSARGARDTNFLVRPSEATPGEMSLSVKISDVQHFKILRDQQSRYFIWNDAPHFSSINKLIAHYKANSVSKTGRAVLREAGAGGGVIGSGGVVGGGGVGGVVGGGGVGGGGFGGRGNTGPAFNPTPVPAHTSQKTVTAKFDFNARNDEELTIYEGDVINLIEKVDADWLKGSIRRNGALVSGLFPANYV